MRRSHLLQARRYEDILRSRPRVRARLRRTGPVPVFVLELRAAEGYQSNVCTLDFPTVLSVLRLHCPGSILHALAAAPLVLSPERGFFYTQRASQNASVKGEAELGESPLFYPDEALIGAAANHQSAVAVMVVQAAFFTVVVASDGGCLLTMVTRSRSIQYSSQSERWT
jgi:hypothetical protein